MKLFLDTAHLPTIEKFKETGLIDGITTNPTLLSKEGSDPAHVAQKICTLLPQGDISIEVTEKEPLKLYHQAQRIAELSPAVVVKIPFAEEYLSIIHRLSNENIRVNVTLVFSPIQAIMVAKLGAYYISPFVGRWSDIGVNGIEIVRNMVELKRRYGFHSKILAASIRTMIDWQEALQAGADAVTVPPALFTKALDHPLTRQGIQIFDEDWHRAGIKNFF